MSLIIQKFGGTSLANIECMQAVTDIILKAKNAGHDVVVVVSAMHGETDRLILLSKQITEIPDSREYDALVSTGECVSAALLSLLLQKKGFLACSLTGQQAEIKTIGAHQRAEIHDITGNKLRELLFKGVIPVVTGFQGMNEMNEVTTLARGGSDLTAIAIAAALKADECDIYTDVEGIFTSDPRVVTQAKLLDKITYAEMLALASLGAKVMQKKAVEYAKANRIKIRVLSSFKSGTGTLISDDENVKKPLVSGVAFERRQSKLSILGIPKKTETVNFILNVMQTLNFEVDMTMQHFSAQDETIDFSFTVHLDDYPVAFDFTNKLAKNISAREVVSDKTVAKLSVVGLGMESHAGFSSKIFQTLNAEGIHIYSISSSEAKISTVIDAKHMEFGARLLHKAFDLEC